MQKKKVASKKKTPSKPVPKNPFDFESFKNLSQVISSLKKPAFKKAPESECSSKISAVLLEQIQKCKTPCFLLPAVIDFIDQVNVQLRPLEYTFSHFEFWLNQFSGLSEEENYLVRAKIVGKFIPRDQYQSLFPIGNGKRYVGSHYVTAHGSPDLDTTIASFWGWVDAFGARVSEGLHIWNMPPGGIFSSLEASPLTDAFNKRLFKNICQNRSSLAPSSVDFTTQKTLIKKNLSDSSISPEDHERHKHAVMVVDKKGFYVGDIRSEDYESIRQIIRLVTNNLRWFENALHIRLIDLFSKKTVDLQGVSDVLKHIYNQKLTDYVINKQLTDKIKAQVKDYLTNILGLSKGLEASFKELAQSLKKRGVKKLASLSDQLEAAFKKNKVFNASGKLANKREAIFKSFNQISSGIEDAIEEMRTFMSSLDIAIQIKRKVFKFPARYVTPYASLDEVVDKISVFNHLSVVFPNKDGSFWPLGIIKAEDIRSKYLGTVSLRDFCNRSEVKIDSSLEIISVLDHHKTDLKTLNPPLSLTGDVQSCNIIVAEEAFKINDCYSYGFLTDKKLEKEIKSVSSKPLTSSLARIQSRLLSKKIALEKKGGYFIHPSREYFEYLSFLHAIIDDTDLLSKATKRDVYCVASLLNRMRSIKDKKEVEVINFDHLIEDESFVSKAVEAIVKNEDMYEVYKSIYGKREKAIEKAITHTATGKTMEFFSDTKEQNGCCRISQSKVFSKNIKSYEKHFEKLLQVWWEKADEVYSNHESIDLHLHMISTIPGAQDVFNGGEPTYRHRDHMWIYIPDSNQAIHHLSAFLNAFKNAPNVQNNHMEYQVLGSSEVNYAELFKHHFSAAVSQKKVSIKKKMPIVLLSFDAGTLNSRKAQITPYLPVLVK